MERDFPSEVLLNPGSGAIFRLSKVIDNNDLNKDDKFKACQMLLHHAVTQNNLE